MSRAQRLLDLADVLRRHRRPVPGHVLAAELGVSLRTLYRDVDTLVGQGAPIEGEAGVGYVLKPGWLLPPLTFPDDELQALALGCQWVTRVGDPRLARAAQSALGRIEAVLPRATLESLSDLGLLIAPSAAPAAVVDLGVLRDAIRREHKLAITYDDGQRRSERVIWPIALAFLQNVRIVAAWCELRQDYRHFRADRIVGMSPSGERYPRRRRAMVKEWRLAAGIPDSVA